MIIRMMTTSRPQQRYDHRLRELVQRTGDLTIATDLGVPRSTARGWLGAAPTVVVSLEAANLTEPELRQEILKLRRRVEKLAVLLRLALALLQQWLFLHSLESVATIRRLVAFYVHEHNHVLPHSAFRGQTPDEMYFGTGDAVAAELRSRAAAARQARVEANRSASCETCPSLNAVA